MARDKYIFDQVWIEPQISHLMFVDLKIHFQLKKVPVGEKNYII